MLETILIKSYKNPQACRHFDALKWLIAAAANKDVKRANISDAFAIIDGMYFATDGHRMHIYQPDSDELPLDYRLADGEYDVKQATKSQILLQKRDINMFPDVWRPLQYRPFNGLPDYMPSQLESYALSTFLRYVYQHIGLFNVKFLSDAFMPLVNMHFERTGDGEYAALVFGNETRVAVVMPILEAGT